MVCLITDKLASHNNLRVGDTITIDLISANDMRYYEQSGVTDEDIHMTLEIIGIYHNNEELDENSDEYKWMSRYDSPDNTILAPALAYGNAFYTLKNNIRKITRMWKCRPRKAIRMSTKRSSCWTIR